MMYAHMLGELLCLHTYIDSWSLLLGVESGIAGYLTLLHGFTSISLVVGLTKTVHTQKIYRGCIAGCHEESLGTKCPTCSHYERHLAILVPMRWCGTPTKSIGQITPLMRLFFILAVLSAWTSLNHINLFGCLGSLVGSNAFPPPH